MTEQSDIVRFQAEHHPLEGTNRFESEEGFCLHLMHLKAYEEIAKLAAGKTVLDLGCNNGWGSQVIGASAARVVGADVSQASIDEARRAHAAPNIEFVQVSGEGLPFGDGEFDLLASCQVIEHVADYGPYLREIVRVLKPGGTAVFTTPNARIRLDPGMKPWNPFHVREFSGAELMDLLREWFEHVEVQGLFATPALYAIEFARSQHNREQSRRRAKAVLPPYKELRTKAIDAVKSVLPKRVVASIQSAVRATTTAAEVGAATERRTIDPTMLDRFSSSDFHYAKAEIDASLDLLAICRTRLAR